MKHYNEEPVCCYPKNNMMEVCANCAKYIENKRDGEYSVVDYRASGIAMIVTNAEGEQEATIYSNCHEDGNYMMFELFDDGEPEVVEEVVEEVPAEDADSATEEVEGTTEDVEDVVTVDPIELEDSVEYGEEVQLEEE